MTFKFFKVSGKLAMRWHKFMLLFHSN